MKRGVTPLVIWLVVSEYEEEEREGIDICQ